MFHYLLLVGAVVGVAAYFFLLRPDLGKTEQTLGALASQIAGRPVTVKCQGVVAGAVDVTASGGKVIFDANGRPGDVAELKRTVCTHLNEFPDTVSDARYRCLVSATECPRDIDRYVFAIHTLTHEAWHLRGVADERLAECYALQTDQLVASRLGANRSLSRAIAVYYATEKYTRLSSKYQSPACRNGGRYDLNRGSRAWP